MQKIDLSQMSIPELDALRTHLNETLTAKIEAEEAAIQERLAALAVIKSGRKNGGQNGSEKSPPKFQHPQNATLTWAGRGAQPAWLAEEVAKGRKLEDFAVRQKAA
jgi:DNA-binding protein H-NS